MAHAHPDLQTRNPSHHPPRTRIPRNRQLECHTPWAGPSFFCVGLCELRRSHTWSYILVVGTLARHLHAECQAPLTNASTSAGIIKNAGLKFQLPIQLPPRAHRPCHRQQARNFTGTPQVQYAVEFAPPSSGSGTTQESKIKNFARIKETRTEPSYQVLARKTRDLASAEFHTEFGIRKGIWSQR